MKNPTQDRQPKIRTCPGTREHCTIIRQAKARKSRNAEIPATYQNCNLDEISASRQKPHVPRNATYIKDDFGRVYFQNMRLLLDGAIAPGTVPAGDLTP